MLAAIATAVVWLCEFGLVQGVYHGNWTGLFCIAPHMPVPEFLRAERLYIFQGTEGYDGQVYHLIAHDPWMRRGSAQAIGDAAFRYQRIFVPALAWMLALGRDEYVHAAYFAVILAFVFLGVYWMARLARARGLPPAWGLAFLAIPATFTSADRMTADVALAALLVAFALYAQSASNLTIAAIFAAAALTRETAALAALGYAAYLVSRANLARAACVCASLAPAGAWFLYVTHFSARSEAFGYMTWIPFGGFLERLSHPAAYPFTGWRRDVPLLLDWIALAGVAVMFAMVARTALARRWNAVAAAMYAFGIAAVFLSSRDVWVDAYNYGRVLSPLLLLALVEPWPASTPWTLAPLALIDLRPALYIGGEIKAAVLGLLK